MKMSHKEGRRMILLFLIVTTLTQVGVGGDESTRKPSEEVEREPSLVERAIGITGAGLNSHRWDKLKTWAKMGWMKFHPPSAGKKMSGCGSQTASSDSVNVSSSSLLKRSSTDVGWEYGALVDPINLDKLKCKLCGKVCSGGIYRIKQHIGHIKENVASCPRSTKEDQDKCKAAIEASKNKKKEKRKQEEIIRKEVQIDEQDEKQEIEGIHTKKRNRLDVERLNNLVYVQFNAKLINKKKREVTDDVLHSSEPIHTQGWVVEGGDDDEDDSGPHEGLTWAMVGQASGADDYLQPRRSSRNVVPEQEVESETEDEGDEDVECESDGPSMAFVDYEEVGSLPTDT